MAGRNNKGEPSILNMLMDQLQLSSLHQREKQVCEVATILKFAVLTMHMAAATALALRTPPKTLWFIDALTSTASKKRFPVGSTV